MKRTEMNRTPFAVKPKSTKPDRAPRITHKRGQSSIWRSDAYLALVRSLPCVCCGAHGLTEAAHSNRLVYGKARGLKASDATAMALCRTIPGRNGCHATLDQGGKMTKPERNQFEDTCISITVMSLWHQKMIIGGWDTSIKESDEMAAHLVAMIESGDLRIA